MSDFTILKPQRVQHSSGYVVQSAGRESVEFIGVDGRVGRVEVEFGLPTVYVYSDSLKAWEGAGSEEAMSIAEREHVLGCIVAGLEAMGSPAELCDDGEGS